MFDKQFCTLWEFLLRERLIYEDDLTVAALFSLIRPLTTFLMFLLLWRYYDSIDDRSFNRFRKDPATRRVFRDPGQCAC